MRSLPTRIYMWKATKLRTIFPLCSYKKQQNLVCHMQLQQQHDVCSQSLPNGCAFSKNMFVACMQAAQHMHGAPVCISLNTFALFLILITVPGVLPVVRMVYWFFRVGQTQRCVLNGSPQGSQNFYHSITYFFPFF